MTTQRKWYLSGDSSAIALGADRLAKQLLAADTSLNLIRNSSRALFWLEPLLEVELPTQSGLRRIGFGPLNKATLTALLAEGLLDIHADHALLKHPLCLGHLNEHTFLKTQQRVVFKRLGLHAPLDIAAYTSSQGFVGLARVLTLQPTQVIEQLKASGLRGRGGAAFPAAIKWQTVANAASPKKYVVCNADEGDSGSYADRLVMEGDPLALIEGMLIAAYAVGADEGYVYIRSEYPHAITMMEKAVAVASEFFKSQAHIPETLKHFQLHIRKAAGSYVCGEETAMLESLEGKRGVVRAKPPLPAIEGLFGRPTVVNNVLTLASVPMIFVNGADWYAQLGRGKSTGTMAFQLAGNIKRGGLVELPFGITLRELVETYGGGTRSGKPIKAIQVGGPLGSYVDPAHWDTPMDYDGYAAIGAVLGHGSVVVHDDSSNLAQLARYAMEFCAIESCGKCTPCRIGSTRGVEVIDRIVQTDNSQHKAEQIELLNDLCETMIHGSLCAMGGMTPFPVQSALKFYPKDFGLDHAKL
jgi:formate dehydrogenase iron-sulfur subunit